MNKKICGVSKRHMRRLVAKQLYSSTYIDKRQIGSQENCAGTSSEPSVDNMHRCNATLGRYNENDVELNFLRARCGELEQNNKILKENFAKIENNFISQNETLAKHTAFLERLAEKAFPEQKNLKFFPIENREQLEDVESKLNTYNEHDFITYIKQLIGTTPVYKTLDLLFTEKFTLQVNWDGKQKKVPINSMKLFNTFVFDAVKNEKLGYNDFVKEMKRGFRLIKNRFYRKKFEGKTKHD